MNEDVPARLSMVSGERGAGAPKNGPLLDGIFRLVNEQGDYRERATQRLGCYAYRLGLQRQVLEARDNTGPEYYEIIGTNKEKL